MLITPPHVQKHLDVLFNAGWFFTNTVGDPGAHGPVITGTHGCGVSTPLAAVVADATAGLDSVLHMPNGGMLTIGFISMMLAAGAPAVIIFSGVTFNVAGARPKVHCMTAPLVTS
jgi:hypothetical protein